MKARATTDTFAYLYGVCAVVPGGGRDVKANLHERHFGVVVLMELHRDLVLARGALRHVGQRDLERWIVVNVEGQQRP